jgi:hypothetical protein
MILMRRVAWGYCLNRISEPHLLFLRVAILLLCPRMTGGRPLTQQDDFDFPSSGVAYPFGFGF